MATRIVGGYEIVAELGRGGVGDTFAATAAAGVLAGRLVCLKVLGRHHEVQTAQMRKAAAQALAHEATVVGSLDHPNVARLLDSGTYKGATYLVFELVDGANLLNVMMMHRPACLPAQEVTHIGLEVSRALAYAHERDVLHRDVKPTNILISEQGEVKLVDFGLAKLGAADAQQFTRHVGTPRYWAAEQIRGETLTPATDVYALGVVLYEALMNKHPYHSDDATTFQQNVLQGGLVEPLSGRGVCRQLAGIIERCLLPEAKERYADGAALATALGNVLQPEAGRADLGRLVAAARRQAERLADGELHDESSTSEEEDDDDSFGEAQESTRPANPISQAFTRPSSTCLEDPTVIATTADRVADVRDEPNDVPTRLAPKSDAKKQERVFGQDAAAAAFRGGTAESIFRRPSGPAGQARSELAALTHGGAATGAEESVDSDASLGDLLEDSKAGPPSAVTEANTEPYEPAAEEAAPPTRLEPTRAHRASPMPPGWMLWVGAALLAGVAAVVMSQLERADSAREGGREPSASSLEPSKDEPHVRPTEPKRPTVALDRAVSGHPAADGQRPLPPSEPSPAGPEPSVVEPPLQHRTPTRRQAPAAELVEVRIGLIPGGEVRVDGKLIGTAPVTVRLSPGRHRIVGSNGRLRHQRLVTIPSHSDEVVIDLRDAK